MKKVFQFFAIFSIALLSLTSCSSDDSTNSVVLLKKLQAGVMGDNEEYLFSYNGTKLTEISFQIEMGTTTSGYSTFVYAGDLITQVKDYNSSDANTYNTFFTYNTDGKLTEVLKVQVGVDHAEKTVFTYNSDNTVNSQYYRGTTSSLGYLTATEKFYFEGNQLIKKDYSYDITSDFQVAYIYDTANHPMKNVTGMDGIKLYVNSFYGFLSLGLKGVSNNIVKETHYNGSGVISYVVDFESAYNDENYPVSMYSTPDSPGPYNYNYEYNR